MNQKIGLVLVLSLVLSIAFAQYPERNINIMVPFGAGGGTDVPARFFAQELEEILDVNIVVSNVTGAGGTVGATQLSQADANGYNLGFMPVGTTTTQPHLKNTSYTNESWAPVCLVAQSPQYISVLMISEYQDVDDLIEQAKSGRVITGGPPPGSLPHIGQAAVANAYDASFDYIPQQGIDETAKLMLGGQVDMTIGLGDYAERFGLRHLAVLDSQRSPDYPDVPTLIELGHEVISFVWFGFFAPAGTPEDVLETLSSACETAVAQDRFVENMAGAKRIVRYMPRDEFTNFFNEQYEVNGRLLEETGLLGN